MYGYVCIYFVTAKLRGYCRIVANEKNLSGKICFVALVAQWIEYWPPKPRTAVRACAGALNEAAPQRLFCLEKLAHALALILGYNRIVQLKNILLCSTAIILCAGCGGIANENSPTAMPNFLTATLPPTLSRQATQTSTLAAPMPSVVVEEATPSPIEGMTTTQLNVRAEPSTASASLGMIGQFIKVQVIGSDTNRSWYQIIYAESQAGKGWVRAEYVQVNAPAEIPLVGTTSSSGAVSGFVIQKTNVRNGPGTEFELLGVLNSNDVIFITGRDASGAWIQIEFASAPDGKGWVTAEFLQADMENAPLIGTAVDETPAPIVEMPTAASAMTAAQDGDSMQSPLAVTVFSATGSRALQARGDISAPNGDAEDWIQFTTFGGVVEVQVMCSSTTLRAELSNHEKLVDSFSCGEQFTVQAATGSNYFLRLIQSEDGYTEYILNLEVIP